MDIKDVFVSVAVVLIGMIAVLTFMSQINTEYNTNLGGTFNNSMKQVQLLQNVRDVGGTVGNNTQFPEGGGEEDIDKLLGRKSLSTFSKVTKMLGIIPSLIGDAGNIISGAVGLDGDNLYVEIAQFIFVAVFAILLAFILLLGVKRIVG